MTARTTGWAAPVVVAGLALLPGLFIGASLDAAVFGVGGWRLTEGGLPYLDVWDHKPPGIYLLHAIAYLLPGTSPWAWTWILTLLATVATAWTVRAILVGRVVSWAATIAAVGCAAAMGQYFVSLGGGMSESFAAFPAAGAIFLAGDRRKPSIASEVGSGALVGVAILISPHLAAAAAAVGVIAWSSGPRALVAAVIGGLLVAGAAIGVLLVTGAWPTFLDAVVGYNAAYRALAGSGYALVPWVVLGLIPFIALALTAVIASRRLDRDKRVLAGAALAWIAAGVLLSAIQGRFYAHHAIGMIIPLSILAAIGGADVARRLRRPPARLAAAVTLGLLVVLSGVVGAAAAAMERAIIEPPNDRSRAFAEWVDAQDLDEPPSLFVWGNIPHAYLATQLRPATRYVYLFPLTTPGYATHRRVHHAVDELERTPPTFVIDAGSSAPGQPGFVPLLIDRPVASEGRILDLLDPLRTFVAERYDHVDTVAGWPVYRLRD